jgi:hypothetical protein
VQSHSCEGDDGSVTSEIPCHLWNPTIHYRVHENLPMVQVRSQMNRYTVIYSISLRFILILFSHLRPGSPMGLFRSGFLTKCLYVFLIPQICVTCPINFILLYLFILKISVSRTNCKASHYAVFFNIALLPLTWVQQLTTSL